MTEFICGDSLWHWLGIESFRGSNHSQILVIHYLLDLVFSTELRWVVLYGWGVDNAIFLGPDAAEVFALIDEVSLHNRWLSFFLLRVLIVLRLTNRVQLSRWYVVFRHLYLSDWKHLTLLHRTNYFFIRSSAHLLVHWGAHLLHLEVGDDGLYSFRLWLYWRYWSWYINDVIRRFVLEFVEWLLIPISAIPLYFRTIVCTFILTSMKASCRNTTSWMPFWWLKEWILRCDVTSEHCHPFTPMGISALAKLLHTILELLEWCRLLWFL